MRSIELVLGFIVLLAGCQAQEEVSVGDLNYIGTPVDTRVEIDLVKPVKMDARCIVQFYRTYTKPFKIDTVISPGDRKLRLLIPLEKPIIMKIRIGENWEHLFVIPGRDVKASYDANLSSLSKIRLISDKVDDDLSIINEYYNKRFELLNVKKGVSEAYRKYNMIKDSKEVIEAYEDLSMTQLDLLKKYQHRLPLWFIEYEQKGIDYLATYFVLSNRMFHVGIQKLNNLPAEYRKLVDRIDLDSNLGMLNGSYFNLLDIISYLTQCTERCNSEGSVRFEALIKGQIKFGKTLNNDQIRQIFMAHNLFGIYRASRSGTDSLVRAFEDEVGEPYLSDVQKIKNPSLIGQPAGNFYLSDPEGEFHTLEDLRGKVVLLNFWFVGCKPCEEQIQYEKALAEKMRDKDFVLVNICTNTGEEAWKEYIKEKGLPGLNLYAKGNWGNKLTKSYQVSGFPTYVLVDKDNTVTNDKAPRPSDEELVVQITEKL